MTFGKIEPKIYRQYADDASLLFKNAQQVENFKKNLNTPHTNIKFTSEINSLPFHVLRRLFAKPHSAELLRIMKALYLYYIS